jgi:tripartite-type tricarboxylate transporter receptor subunit TctC
MLRWHQPLFIENRPGASSTLGVAAAGLAAPDGYTLVMAGSGSLTIAPTAFDKLPYDPTKDFAPIALIATIPFVLVSIPLCRSNPSPISSGMRNRSPVN